MDQDSDCRNTRIQIREISGFGLTKYQDSDWRNNKVGIGENIRDLIYPEKLLSCIPIMDQAVLEGVDADLNHPDSENSFLLLFKRKSNQHWSTL